MSTSVPPTSEPESAFVCDCDKRMRSACEGEPFYKEHEGKRYCVLHFPSKEKSADFEKALQRKLENKDFNFHGVWFPDELSLSNFDFSADADFRYTTFSADASFRYATFSSDANLYRATFRAKADFSFATFSADANFRVATFSSAAYFSTATFSADADFIFATFSAEVYFSNATFSGAADFSNATFSADADFRDATFSAAADFSAATFAGHVSFAGYEKPPVFTDTSSLDLQFARIEKADRVSFHTLRLRLHWFVNVDAGKFEFTNVDWDWRSIDEEVVSLRVKSVSPAHRLLSIACWHLAVNAEENHRYEEASRFRYMAMDARRLQLRERMRGNLFKAHWRVLKKTLARLHWSLRRDWGVRGRTLTRLKRFIRVYGKTLNLLYRLYWMVSGYGERIIRASAVLAGIWFISALLYTFFDFRPSEPKLASEADVASAKRVEIGAPLKFSRALVYSVGVMTLQKPEPRPATASAETVVLLETILGPVQAALLALAIRRKFMR